MLVDVTLPIRFASLVRFELFLVWAGYSSSYGFERLSGEPEIAFFSYYMALSARVGKLETIELSRMSVLSLSLSVLLDSLFVRSPVFSPSRP